MSGTTGDAAFLHGSAMYRVEVNGAGTEQSQKGHDEHKMQYLRVKHRMHGNLISTYSSLLQSCTTSLTQASRYWSLPS